MKQKKAALTKELGQFKHLIGKWIFVGYFKDDASKTVEGWETYKASKSGLYISCQWRVDTIAPEGRDINKGKMKIFFNNEEKRIVGETPDTEYVLSFANNTLSIQNDAYRFTGKLNSKKKKISGKWETKEKSRWKYWYDKILTKTGE